MTNLDVLGKVYNKLTVMSIDDNKTNTKRKFVMCKCSCGEIKSVRLDSLKDGSVKSCGCLKNENLTGKRFGRLLVICKKEEKIVQNINHWECLCDCGNTVFIRTALLKNGNTQSCGCLRTDQTTKHGRTNSAEYRVWDAMKQRCYNVNNLNYYNYGGRGISVCDEWINSFENFYKDMGNRPSTSHSLDRIDVNGNYSKENCRWATQSEQCFNTRKHVTNSSGRTGVSFNKLLNKFEAYIDYQTKRIGLGCFDLFEDAVIARSNAELKYFGYNKE